jgi:glycosyltransferase involved in cell wall biosynthesis
VSRRTVALVHERFTEVAGSEQVVAQLSAEFPDAAVHAPIARPSGVPPQLARPPVTTWVDQLYRRSGRRSYAPLLPLLPGAFRGMSLRGADVVVASHHAFATQVVHATDAPVLAYVHSPARWAWDAQLRRGEAGGAVGTLALNALSARTRRHELVASARLAVVVANSTAVAQRIQRCWRRSATVVHPPVDTEFYTPDPSVPREGFVLLAGRLVPYKRPDLAVRAAERAGIALVVAGDGRAMER